MEKKNYGAQQGLVFWPHLFLIYINDLPDGITVKFWLMRLFVLELDKSINELNTDLQKISQWFNQWKIQSNPDPEKQANEVIFCRKLVSNKI